MAKASKESVVPYPTSAKKGPAKWDKIEAEVKVDAAYRDFLGLIGHGG